MLLFCGKEGVIVEVGQCEDRVFKRYAQGFIGAFDADLAFRGDQGHAHETKHGCLDMATDPFGFPDHGVRMDSGEIRMDSFVLV